MLNISKSGEFDPCTIDMRTITPEDWEAVKRAIIRRAHAERIKAMREFLAQFRSRRQPNEQGVELLST